MYKDYSKVVKNNSLNVNTTNEEANAINNSIKNILTTTVGTVPGKPEFGSNIARYTFEQMDFITENIIREDILLSLRRYEPRINIQNIELRSVPEYNKYIIDILYSYRVQSVVKTETASISIAS